MKLLVCGGAGFIGFNFIRWALEGQDSLEITCLDALTYAGNEDNFNYLAKETAPRFRFLKGQIENRTLVENLVSEHDAVINFAAESHVDRSITGPEQFITTNIVGTFTLLDAMRTRASKKRLVQVSTDEVYGSLGSDGKFSEATPLAPNSPYSASKASADLLVRSYHHTYNLDLVTTRCSNNYGPFQYPEKLIPLMIQRALKNEKLPVYGDGLNIRDWIHVDDHNRGIWAALIEGRSGEVYNFGSDNEWRNIDIVKEILRLLNRPESLISYVQDRLGHDRRYAVDASKAHRELGWKPRIDFSKGLPETVNWYLKNSQWIENLKQREGAKS